MSYAHWTPIRVKPAIAQRVAERPLKRRDREPWFRKRKGGNSRQIISRLEGKRKTDTGQSAFFLAPYLEDPPRPQDLP